MNVLERVLKAFGSPYTVAPEPVAKFNPFHYPKGFGGGRGGKFAPKGLEGDAKSDVEHESKLADGFHWAGPEEIKAFNEGAKKANAELVRANRSAKKHDLIAPNMRDVQINNDNKAHVLYRAMVGPKDTLGSDGKPVAKAKIGYSADHHEAAAATKYSRVSAFMKDAPALDEMLRKDIKEIPRDHTPMALWVIRNTGMRPGGGGGTSKNRATGAYEDTFGATSLQLKHASVDARGVTTFKYKGKSGFPITQRTQDPLIAKFVRERKAAGKPNDMLFDFKQPGRSVAPKDPTGRLNDYVKKAFPGKGYVPKDLRTMRSTQAAQAHLATIKKMPTSKKEFDQIRFAASVHSAKALGHVTTGTGANQKSTMDLNSYIDPAIFDKFRLDPTW